MSIHSSIRGRAIVDDPEHSCTLGFIKRRLGATMSDKRMCAYVTELISKKGFPEPMPAFRCGQLIEHVIPHSRWVRAGVEVWFDNYLPPEAHAAIDAASRAAAADDMDQAATGLGKLRLVGGGRS